MANTTISPNMGLVLPTVSADPGPDWANNLNASLTTVDQHNHAPGSGVPISQSGISLTANATTFDSLSFNQSNAYNLRSVRFFAQAAPLALGTDIGCLYESGVDLYYNDGNGNKIRITQSGSVAGATGTITGLPSGTASASYAAGTFTFQSATNTPANISGASYKIAQQVASPNFITLQSPNSLTAAYSLTLFTAIPSATGIVQLDTSGDLSAALVVDNSTLQNSSNTLSVKAQGITATQIANGTITNTQIANQTITQGLLALRATGSTVAAGGVATSSSSSSFSTNSATPVDVTNLLITITTTGRPVFLGLQPDGLGGSYLSVTDSTNHPNASILFHNDTSASTPGTSQIQGQSGNGTALAVPAGSAWVIDFPAAGTYTYSVRAFVAITTTTIAVQDCVLIAYEL